jgi:heme exporter protein A
VRLTGTDLAAVRGGRAVFAGLSFDVAEGDLIAVVGANGTGKSTLLRLVAGLLPPAAGSVRIDPAGDAPRTGTLHYLGHLDGLKTILTVRQNLAFWQRVWAGGYDAVEAAIDRLGLAHLADLSAGVLSAGPKRRVAIARLLVVPRPVWLLDEPATALDAAAETMLDGLVAAHLAGGGVAMIATHREMSVAPTATLRLGAA